MATLQKFKFLATQCAVISSPTRSPTTSPVVHIRRRKTLRMLLGKSTTAFNSGSSFHRRFLHHYRNESTPPSDNKPPQSSSNNNSSSIGVRSKLKDLFVSSPPSTAENTAEERLLKESGRSCGESLVAARRGGNGGVRPLSATLRQRLLLRRAWRPVLVGIPEVSP